MFIVVFNVSLYLNWLRSYSGNEAHFVNSGVCCLLQNQKTLNCTLRKSLCLNNHYTHCSFLSLFYWDYHSHFTVNYLFNKHERDRPSSLALSAVCKHDYIEEVALHFWIHSDSQLRLVLARLILQMQCVWGVTGRDGGRLEQAKKKEERIDRIREQLKEKKQEKYCRLGCNYCVRHHLSVVYFDSNANSWEGYLWVCEYEDYGIQL